jgi:signal transduction histidine kinase
MWHRGASATKAPSITSAWIRVKVIYGDPASWCKKVEDSSSGVWNEYWWPKPGQNEPSRKLSYHLRAKGTSYVVSAGIYDDKATIAEVSKLSSMK